MGDKLYTIEEAAEILDIHPNTLRRWLRQGVIKGEKYGRLWRVKESELLRTKNNPE